MTTESVRLLHISDIHCGAPFVSHHVDAAQTLAASMRFDAIAISGDLSQRSRTHELRAARKILDALREIAPLLVVSGNHDAAWWYAPFGVGWRSRVHARWRRYIQSELEPTLCVPGLALIGLNSAPGAMPRTVTMNPRDWSVKGGLTTSQIEAARTRVGNTSPSDLRVLVTHHNVVRGRLSDRWGMTKPEQTLQALASLGADVICTGHDHEERVERVVLGPHALVVSGANTLSNRVRGHRASALNVIDADATTVAVTIWKYDEDVRAFTLGQSSRFPRALR